MNVSFIQDGYGIKMTELNEKYLENQWKSFSMY